MSLVVSAKLTADARGFTAEVGKAKADLRELSSSAAGSGSAATTAGRGLHSMGSSAGSAADQVRDLNQASQSLATKLRDVAAIAGTLGLGVALKGLVDTNVEFQSLEASLKTVTGSAEAAGVAFAALQDFAATTPYRLSEVVEAFIKLKALGLDPSMESLRAYGNTASATNKDLMQWIEAVADAATGQFERLLDFGIKASSAGDKVSFTFQNVSTTVAKTGPAIEAYLRRIGSETFAGAMIGQMVILKGAFSNLGDAVSTFFSRVGNAGFNDALRDLVSDMTASVSGAGDFARDLGETLASGLRASGLAMGFMAEHSRAVAAALAGIAAAGTARALVSIAGAARAAAAALLTMEAPLIALDLGVAAIAAATAALVYFGDTTVDVAGQTATVTDYLVAGWDMAREMVERAGQTLADVAASPWGAGIVQTVSAVTDAIRQGFNTQIATVAAVVQVAPIAAKALAEAFGRAVTYVLDLLGDLGRSVRALVEGEFSLAGNIAAESFGRSFDSGLAGTGGKIADAMSGSFRRDWIGDALAGAWEGAGDLAAPLVDNVAGRAARRYRDRLAQDLVVTPEFDTSSLQHVRPSAGSQESPEAQKKRQDALEDIEREAIAQQRLAAALSGTAAARRAAEKANWLDQQTAKNVPGDPTALAAGWDALRDAQEQAAEIDVLSRLSEGAMAASEEADAVLQGADAQREANRAAQLRALSEQGLSAAALDTARSILELTDAENRRALASRMALSISPDLAWGQQRAELERFRDALIEAGATQEDVARAALEADQRMLASKRDWASGVARAAMDIQDTAGDMASHVDDAMHDLAKGSEDAFVSFVWGSQTMALAFSSMADRLIEDIWRIFYEMLILEPIMGAIEGSVGSVFGTPTASSATDTTGPGGAGFSYSYYGGPRAGGGPVSAGQYFLVGESGPELFIPGSSGTIIPNAGIPAPMPAQGGGWGQGGTIRPVINVVVHNDTGQPIGQGAVRATPRSDGGMDLNLYLERRIDARVNQSFADRGALPANVVRRS